VVPIAEIDHWIDLDDDLATHVMVVAKRVASAQQQIFSPAKVGLMIAGLEVPHVHLHVVPIRDVHDLDFANANADPDAAELDRAATSLREALGTTDLA
jgi:histidine triad (HIT) family protein